MKNYDLRTWKKKSRRAKPCMRSVSHIYKIWKKDRERERGQWLNPWIPMTKREISDSFDKIYIYTYLFVLLVVHLFLLIAVILYICDGGVISPFSLMPHLLFWGLSLSIFFCFLFCLFSKQLQCCILELIMKLRLSNPFKLLWQVSYHQNKHYRFCCLFNCNLYCPL